MSDAVTHLRDEFTLHRKMPKPDDVRNHLQEVLGSPAFQGSKRCRQFLAFVCEESLNGSAANLKERTIAVEVFGRDPKSDLADDAIVRVGAREVRKRLLQYYLTPAGIKANIRIELPTGSYAPGFQTVGEPQHAPVFGDSIQPPVPQDRRRANWILAGIVMLSVICGALLATRWFRSSPEEQAFLRFWEPVLHSSEPLLLAMAHPIVYHPSARAWQLSEHNLPPQDPQVPRPIHVPADQLNGSDMLPVENQYVGVGDMVAANEITAMLAQRKRAVRLRLANGIEFPDLRKTNALLIGAISNRWTMQLQQGWRFQFRWTPAVRTVVLDTMQPNRQWFVDSKANETYQEDYVVVGRIRNSLTGGLLLLAAGLKGFGTEAAGRLLADTEQLGSLLRKLPPGWDAQNLQIVLHVKVIGNTPAQPDVVAWHVW